MPCERHGNAIVCSRGGRKLGKCQECFVREATLLCDGPKPAGATWRRGIPGADKTCSKPLCAGCAMHVIPDKDFCREHAAPEKRRLAL